MPSSDVQRGTLAYSHILRAMSESPWALLPSKLATIVDLMQFRAAGGHYSEDEIRERIGSPRAAQPMRVTPAQGGGKVAVLPFYGVVAQRMGMMAQSSGGLSTESFSQLFQNAMADPSVSAIVIEFDSPGGSTFGVAELANQVFKARGTKPIVGQVNSLCASAAYWVASQCDEIVCTPGGQAGSIGVYSIHTDLSAQNEMMGEKYTFISAGRYKTEGNSFQPLTAEAQAAIQSEIDACYAMFTGAVARGRGVSTEEVQNGYGQGRVVGAKQAKALNLVDRVGTLDETVGRLVKGSSRAAMTQKNAAFADGTEIFGGREGGPEIMAPPSLAKGVPVMPWIGEAIVQGIVRGSTSVPVVLQQYDASGHPILQSKAVPANDSPKIAPADEPWDAGEVEKSLPENDQKAWLKVFAWYDETADDPDNDGLPDAKSAWKLPHAKADGTLVPRGLHAAAARLDQLDIPDKDMAGVKAHLAHHYAELKETPPWESKGQAATESEALASNRPNSTTPQEGERQVDEAEFRAELAKRDEQLAAKDAQLEALSANFNKSADQIAVLEAADRKRRFTDMVMGRNGEKDGLRWYGDVAQNVTMLEKLAKAFGEDSEDFKAYVALQETNAKQLQAVTKAVGSDRETGNDAPTAQGRLDAKADELMAANPGMTKAQATLKAAEQNPDLYAEHIVEMRSR